MTPVHLKIGERDLGLIELEPGESQVHNVVGNEAVRVKRDKTDGHGEETYDVDQIAAEYPEDPGELQRLRISNDGSTPSGHFYIDGNIVEAKYVKG